MRWADAEVTCRMCSSGTLGRLRAWQFPLHFPLHGFRFSSLYLHVMSATTLSCGTIVAVDCSDS